VARRRRAERFYACGALERSRAARSTRTLDRIVSRHTARADCFDASALVKVYVEEPRSSVVRSYFESRTTKYTTPFCYYEALSTLKSKWKYRSLLSKQQYLDAAFRLTAWYQASAKHVSDLDLTNLETFRSAQSLVERFGLDLSDAFQIISVRDGYFAPLVNDSQTILITADADLATAARAENLRVWNAMAEDPPA
jgi:predicted nucleic acid-binding protein